jgi:prepilin-type N-terminal cleavage/methylation domain-containing protein
MKPSHPCRKRGFSLIETVIAIGVLAVLLTGFMIVFAPAAAGIRKSINVQEADRLATTLEQELVTFRTGDTGGNGFGKAFTWIKESNTANTNNALLIYQYRGSLSSTRQDDKTPEPVGSKELANKLPGKDYTVQTMVRRKSDPKFLEDLNAIEGSVYVVKCTQLVFNGGQLTTAKTPGQIQDPKTPAGDVGNADAYPEAVIAFSAEFHALQGKSAGYFGAPFTKFFTNAKNPVFSRNLAVRR